MNHRFVPITGKRDLATRNKNQWISAGDKAEETDLKTKLVCRARY
jgi:hypothetical protein